LHSGQEAINPEGIAQCVVSPTEPVLIGAHSNPGGLVAFRTAG